MITSVAPNAIVLVLSAALVMAGAAAALGSSNIGKRFAGVLVALIAAMLGAGALGAGGALVVAVVAIAFVYCAVGASLMARLQEAYASAETGEIDAADTADETPEQGA